MAYWMSAGLTPASANAAAPERAAPVVVRSTSPARGPRTVSPLPITLTSGPLQAARDLRPRDDQRAAAVADHAAVEPVQRIGDDRRIQHVLHRDQLAQHRVWVVLRMVRRGHLDPRQLLGGGAELVHVAHRDHAVAVDGGDAVRALPRRLGRAGARARRGAAGAFAARPAGQGDQCDVAAAGGDRIARMRHQRDVRRAAEVGALGVAHLQVEVVDHRRRAHAGRIAGTEIAIDVALAQARVAQRAGRALGMQLGHGLVGRLACRVLEGTDDAGLGGTGCHGNASFGFDCGCSARDATTARPAKTSRSPTAARSSMWASPSASTDATVTCTSTSSPGRTGAR